MVQECGIYSTYYMTMSTFLIAKDNRLFILAGGVADTGTLDTVNWWGTTSDMDALASFQQGMVGGVGGVVEDQIIVCSTATGCLALDLNAPYTSWTLASPFPSLSFPTGDSINGELWITGGVLDMDISLDVNATLHGGYHPLDEVFNNGGRRSHRQAASNTETIIYYLNSSSATGISVRDGPSLTEQRIGHCSILLDNGDLVLTGGFGPNSYMNLTEKYSIETGYIETLSSLKYPRINHACASFMGASGTETLIVAGGWYGGYIDKVETLVPGDIWVSVQALPEMRLYAKMVTMGGYAYIVGGGQYSGGWQFRNKTLRYNWEDDSWVEELSLSLPAGHVMRHTMQSVPATLLG